MKLPAAFEERMRELLQEEFEEYKESFYKEHYSGLRVNRLKITPEEFLKISPFHLERIPFIENGFYYDGKKEQPAKHPFYHGGLYYIQEPSAMTPASLLPIEEGDKVLDLCAAPGGKSTELAAKLGGTGLLVSNDISNSRAKALLKNIELFGVRNAVVMSEAPSKLVTYFEGYFDKILIDAPCSGEGMFRKTPAIMKNWEEHGVEYYSELQKEIILLAAKMLKPGGKILYSTCTFSPEENEGTIQFLLNELPEFKVIHPLQTSNTVHGDGFSETLGRGLVSYEGFDFGKPHWVDGPEELKNAIRLWPHKMNGEGHFICLLEKKGQVEESFSVYHTNSKKAELSHEAKEFIDELGFEIDKGQIEVRDDKLYLLPKGLPDLKGLRILRTGLLLGEMKKNRFEPNQALAVALKKSEYRKVIDLSVDDENVIKYLKCETLQIEGEHEDGWNLICVEGFPLGFGKLTGNTLKNKYLSGWRWM